MSNQPSTKSAGNDLALGQSFAPALANDMVTLTLPVGMIKEPERSARKIGKRAIATTKAIITQFGLVCPILIDENDTVIAGAEFLIAARELGLKTIKAVRLQTLSDADRRVLTIALARIPELSTWDDQILADEISQLLSLELPYDALDTLGFNIPKLTLSLKPLRPIKTRIRQTACRLPPWKPKRSRERVMFGGLENIALVAGTLWRPKMLCTSLGD